MAFTSYITYKEYKDLGGQVSEASFPSYERKAQRWLDSFTFNRVQLLDTVPDEVKEVLAEFIDKLSTYSGESSDGQVIEKYSNGVEDITYRRTTETELKESLSKLAISWLPDYLVNRSVNFDVREYLQSDSNNS